MLRHTITIHPTYFNHTPIILDFVDMHISPGVPYWLLGIGLVYFQDTLGKSIFECFLISDVLSDPIFGLNSGWQPLLLSHLLFLSIASASHLKRLASGFHLERSQLFRGSIDRRSYRYFFAFLLSIFLGPTMLVFLSFFFSFAFSHYFRYTTSWVDWAGLVPSDVRR